MNLTKTVNKYIKNSSNAILKLNHFNKEIKQIVNIINKTSKQKRTIYVCGNGGSDSQAEHFVTELVCTYKKKTRKPISAISLNSINSSITAWSNDFDYKTFLSRMVNAHCKKGDVLFILTTSGGSNYSDRSKNIVLAAKEAKKKGVTVISFTGKNGGIIRKYSDVFIHIKNKETSYVQESHLVILHLISEILDKNK